MKSLIKKILKEDVNGNIRTINGIEFKVESDNGPYSSGFYLKPVNSPISLEEYNGVTTVLNDVGLKNSIFTGIQSISSIHVEIDIEELLVTYLDIRLETPSMMDQLKGI